MDPRPTTAQQHRGGDDSVAGRVGRLRQAGRARMAAAGEWVGRARYMQKWIALGLVIGVVAGLGAVAFYEALTLATRWLTGSLGGYRAPGPAGEGGGAGTGHFPRAWLIPIIVAAGGLVSGILVFRFAPEAEGHGTDAAIDAVHTNPRKIRARAVGVKLVASAITIGSGGSGGREGPTAQISAGFGSLLARTLNLSGEDGRIVVSVGIGSGIGAIFGAPLGGAVTAADIVYRDDFEGEALVPGFVASITAYAIFGAFEGFSPLFGYVGSSYHFSHPAELLWFAVIGVLAGAVGLLYSGTFYGVIALTKRVPGSRMIKPAVGGLLVGLLALAIPETLGTGYGWVQQALDRQSLLHMSLWIVLALPVAKIVTTSLSIGTGGSGGIFGPGMVIGAFVGAGLWRLVEPWGWAVPHTPAPFVVVAMMACFGAIARAPLAMILMVAEMTGNITLIAPAMVSVGIAYLITGHWHQTIYRSQLPDRASAQAARVMLGLPLLARIEVTDALSMPRLVLEHDCPVDQAAARLRDTGVPGAPVIDDAGRFLGAVRLTDITDHNPTHPGRVIARLADPTAPTVRVNADLEHAVEALPAGQSWLSVLDEENRVVGIISLSDIVRAYHRAAQTDDQRTTHVAARLEVHEFTVRENSQLVGVQLGQARLPARAIVMTVRRGEVTHPASSDLRMQVGDVVTALIRPGVAARLEDLAGTPDDIAAKA